MTRRVIEERIDGDDPVSVRRGEDYVTVAAVCGEDRSFGPDAMYAAIQYIEQFKEYPGSWVVLRDSHDQEFACSVIGDKLFYAPRLPGDVMNVPWTPLKDALEEAIDG